MFVGLRNFLLLAVCLVLGAAQAWAVALGKIEVTSHLGETFYAEAPLQLDSGEKISDVSVELAGSSDYQILEVFRDPSINQLQVDIKNDLRGPRAVISSSDAVDTPYFNLVLKLRHGHATNFKKFPVFLDLPEQVQPAPTVAPAPIAPAPRAPVEPLVEAQPSVSAVSIRPAPAARVEVPQDAAEAEPVGEPTGSQYEPFEGWSRTSRYGPMVRGDTLTTVARRLPVDERYTLNQIMVGLYNKNKSKFRENNINLINAGTYLQVPTAADVEAVSDRQAKQVITEHEKRWKDLKRQPVYAAEAEAQENRYRPRVQIGREASGVASAPNAPQTMPVQQNQQPVATQGMASDGVQATADSMLGLQQENLRLKQALQESEQRASSAKPATADALAAEEKVKKLELTVARLQSQLVQMNQQMQAAQSQGMNTLTYTLMAIVLLLLLVAAYLLFRLRRDRPHPAMDRAAAEAVTAAAAGGAAVALADSADDGDLIPEEATDDVEMDSTAFAESLDADTDDEAASDNDADLLFADQTPAVAQSGVDYLAEADVYLRYGMEDEALQQLNLALEQNPDQPEAHSKMVEMLQSRGDDAATHAAIEAARSALSESNLASFEASLSAGDGGASETDTLAADNDSLVMDAMPDMDMSDGLDFSMDELSSDTQTLDGMSDASVDEASLPQSDETQAEPAEDTSAGMDLDLDLSGMDIPDLGAEPTVAQASTDDADNAGIEMDAFSMPADDAPVVAGDDEALSASDDDAVAEDDFTSSVQITPLASDATETDATETDADTLTDAGEVDFTLGEGTSLDTDIEDALSGFDDEDAGETVSDSVPEADNQAKDDTDTPDDFAAEELGETSEAEIEFSVDDGAEISMTTSADEQEDAASDAPESSDEGPEENGDSAVDLDDMLAELGLDESAVDADSADEASSDHIQETEILASADDDDDLGLDAILGEFEDTDESEPAEGIVGAVPDTAVAEMEIDSEDDDLGLDAILGEFNADDADASDSEATMSAESAEPSLPETVIDTSDDDDLGLDAILGEFADESVESDAAPDLAEHSVADATEIPEMDVSDELDGLLAEWDTDELPDVSSEAGPGSLDIDRAKSLLAEGSLDDAEAALQSALQGDRRADALIGLAETAVKRGDFSRKDELLAEAASLLDDSNRDWFDSVKDMSA